jgi:hypothetical protein
VARLGLPGAFIEDLDHLARCRSLAVIELSKIQYLPLNHAGIMTAPVFDNGALDGADTSIEDNIPA